MLKDSLSTYGWLFWSFCILMLVRREECLQSKVEPGKFKNSSKTNLPPPPHLPSRHQNVEKCAVDNFRHLFKHVKLCIKV